MNKDYSLEWLTRERILFFLKWAAYGLAIIVLIISALDALDNGFQYISGGGPFQLDTVGHLVLFPISFRVCAYMFRDIWKSIIKDLKK